MGISLKTAFKLLVAVAFLMIAVVITASVSTLNRQIEEQFEREAKERTYIVSKLLHHAILISEYHEVQRITETLQDNPRIYSVEVSNRLGDVIASFTQDDRYSEKMFPAVIDIRDDIQPEQKIGTVKIVYSYSLVSSLFRQHFLLLGFAITFLFAGLLTVLILFARYIIRYFDRLKEAFARLEAGNSAGLSTQQPFREVATISNAFNTTADHVRELREREKEQSKLAAVGELAAQVAHDIRSPLAGLKTALENSTKFPETQRVLIRSAVMRIQEIAYALLQKNREAQAAGSPLAEKREPVLLSSLVEMTVTEVRFATRSISSIDIRVEAGSDCYGVFASVNPAAFRRVLSNLIHNAVESFVDQMGEVVVRISKGETDCRIEIRDQGRGISPEVLARLGTRGVTEGKKNGSGLGFYYAKSQIVSWDGTISVSSAVGKGTTVSIQLPRCPAPSWFVSELSLKRDEKAVVLDDDPSIHEVWKNRFGNIGERGAIVHFSTSEDLIHWAAGNRERGDSLFLIDYELAGEKRTGLDVIEDLKLEKNAILVTSRYEEKEILKRCQALGVRMIPKPLASAVPIVRKA